MNRAERRRREREAKRAGSQASEEGIGWLQQALTLHQSGRVAEAEALYRRVLAKDPHQSHARHYLGVAAYQSGRLDEAELHIAEALRDDPGSAEAHTNLGLVLEAQGRSIKAIDEFRKALSLKHDYCEARYNIGVSQLSLNEGEEAAKSFLEAIHLKPDFGLAHYNLGIALEGLGQLRESAAAYGQAVHLMPRHALAHLKLGAVSHRLDQTQKALGHFEQALALEPTMAEAHHNLGIAARFLGDMERAKVHFHRALELEPQRAATHDSLIELLEQSNQVNELTEAVAAVEAACPDHPRLTLWQAMVKKREGAYSAVREILEAREPGPEDPHFNAARAQLLGEACDRIDDPSAAFDYFRQSNEWAARTEQAQEVNPAGYAAFIDRLGAWFATVDPHDWTGAQGLDDRLDPIFLVGFPRSGTTLLDSILRSHPLVGVIEERPMLEAVSTRLAAMERGNPEALATLDPNEIRTLRDLYFERLETFRDEAGDVPHIVDKMPLNMVEAGLICRLFPKARFILALRHPCDCVLSCFMQNFKQNDAMANFRELESAATLYDRVFGLWSRYEALFDPAVYTIRYEDLVDDFEGTLGPLVDFLGLEWTDAFRDFAETARQRGRVRTPSYDQVTQPIYRSASGRWTRYRAQMEPVMPILAPWARHWGYQC
ncbi:tetratricopeptide repeat-containing sulfotransferase family protein [Magnetospira sp. QH-2]|uniref:tetratricopeptide repeat-containing sulfotransferase family protein n=1 Tax=Magnetospira sp. (strain QH-2) TaxID=1288970 RepID=UPI0003E81109|nr:tetratricopeptide repeat-containing sulfotransferase family protein [Magnetospira sp. QH-2]CCQ73959.1 Conserved protein of unknown function. Containing two TPR domains and one sulfotransferase domain [Magnetospira sp. QH-2]